jgi:CubicO group peptidase (beta-lactamase class C family)
MKLPGGGWTSTVADLARFGAGLMGSKLLEEEQAGAVDAEPARRRQADQVGLGFFVGQLDGERLISHSGGQRKTSTYLALLPERRLAVAAMCNTEGAPMETIALGALRLLRGKRQ